jgi:type II secretion system (T2SS) protein E
MRELFKSALGIRPLNRPSLTGPPRCGLVTCSGAQSFWHRALRRKIGFGLEGVHYCSLRCFEHALRIEIARMLAQSPAPTPSNRMPLGLLMVARGKLTYTEVLAALEAQRRARHGKIGEWFEKLGFATEDDVTAALALQWGCPVASSDFTFESNKPAYRIPLPVLESFQMLPLHHVEVTNTLAIAFGERVDHSALYAIEHLLGCRTQPCVAGRSAIANRIEHLRQQSLPGEVQFGPMHDPAEMARIASSYVGKLGSEEVRIRRLASIIWLRLTTRSAAVNLVFRLQDESRQQRKNVRQLPPMGPVQDVDILAGD